jgi:excisionase family DNA binding protein
MEMSRKPLTLPEVADRLGVHYMTVYRYVRTGRLPAKRVRGAWQVDPADLAHVERSRQGPRATGKAPSRARLEARLVASDEAGAWDVLEEALASGMEPDEVLLELIGPALHSIGTLWEQGKLSVADEHRASDVAARLVSRLGARFARRGHRRGTVVLAGAPGELHALPVSIAANLLRWKGFDVVELGADTPAEALVETAAGEPDLLAVGIVCTAAGSPKAARRAVAALHQAVPKVPVLLGGAAVADVAHARRLGADVFTGGRADEVVRCVEAIVAPKSAR